METSEVMKNWFEEDILIERTRRGKPSVCDYADNLIIPSRVGFPSQDLQKKIRKSGHIRDFSSEKHEALTKKLGFYCDLQSLRSEDAITWSVFGSARYASHESQDNFINSLLERIGKKGRMSDCEIILWRRFPHPDTGRISHGPELDFFIQSDEMVIFGESKWTHKISKDQGLSGTKSQLQLREELSRIYTKQKIDALVLHIGLLEESVCGSYYFLSWDDVCMKSMHPYKNELGKYYLWKKEHGIGN